MKYSMFTLIIIIISLSSCGQSVKKYSKEEIAKMTASQIYDLGANAYINKDYQLAKYYYSNIIENFKEDRTMVAWAYYEIGFIEYITKNYESALYFFNQVTKIDTENIAPHILANDMKNKTLDLMR